MASRQPPQILSASHQEDQELPIFPTCYIISTNGTNEQLLREPKQILDDICLAYTNMTPEFVDSIQISSLTTCVIDDVGKFDLMENWRARWYQDLLQGILLR